MDPPTPSPIGSIPNPGGPADVSPPVSKIFQTFVTLPPPPADVSPADLIPSSS